MFACGCKKMASSGFPFARKLKYDTNGLIPAVIQHHVSSVVLMVAYMNEASVAKTFETGKATFWSRSRQKFWIKGESSGHFLYVTDIRVDCDADCLLIRVDPLGPSCHEGYETCFFRKVNENGSDLDVFLERDLEPEAIYGKPGETATLDAK